MRLTKKQQLTVRQKYRISRSGASSYLEFRRRVEPVIGLPAVAVLPWCNMFVCIEPDGYPHT